MNIGDTIQSAKSTYKIVKRISGKDRPNANVYMCSDSEDKLFIAKHFYDLPPMANIAYSKTNHYGRRRDGSAHVFTEIQQMNERYGFLVKHIERFKHKGKWIIILEYIEGDLMSDFIEQNHRSDMPKVLTAVQALAKTLAQWHSNKFALGDPHLANAIVQPDGTGMKVTLIDYSQIHHPDFAYCKDYKCFSPANRRINEDFAENSGKLGWGFRSGLIGIEKKYSLEGLLSKALDENYKVFMNEALKGNA